MTYQRPINTPPLNFTPKANQWGRKLLIALEKQRPFTIPGFDPLPPTVEIVGCRVAVQSAYDLAGIFGNIWIALATPDYVAMSGVPERECCPPFGLIPIGSLPIRAGIDQFRYYDFNEPILYRRGIDQIFIGEEVSGALNKEISPFVTFIVRGVDSQWPSVGSVALNLEAGAAPAEAAGSFSTRTLTMPLSVDGSRVAVHVTAGASGFNASRFSAGVQGSGPDMVAAPAPLLVDGTAPGMALSACGEGWAVGTLNVTAGQRLLINVDHAGAYPWRPVPAGLGSWYGPIGSYDKASMVSAVASANQYVVDCVRVLP